MKQHRQPTTGREALKCVLENFLLSRLLVFLLIFLISPHIPLHPEQPNFRPSFSWSQMNLWDGKWYEKVATEGYEYRPDGREHDINFFPLYPGLVWLLMRSGLGFAQAGTILSNIAFLGALYLLYQRTAEHFGKSAAQWAVAAMAWFPLSVLCSATYSEATFLLITLALLQAFEKQRYWLASLFAAPVAIARIPGMTLVAAIVLVAFFQKLPWQAYLPAISASLALGAFMAFQGFRFHDPAAFVHTQISWEHSTLVDVLRHLYLPNSILRILAWPIAFSLLWFFRGKLCRLDLLYATFCLALILYSRRPGSAVRYIFGIASLFVAAGLWLSERPRLAAPAIGLSTIALSFESLSFAWDHFLG